MPRSIAGMTVDTAAIAASYRRVVAIAGGIAMKFHRAPVRPSQPPSAQRQAAPAHTPAPAAPLPRFSIGNLPPNRTGMPDRLKSGIETLSGVSMDGVRVRYNSPHPAQIGALAYARGREIHLAAGQERHLPHEAWHLVQQAQGRVRPTMQMKDGLAINDDQRLEREADVMGAKATAGAGLTPGRLVPAAAQAHMPVQRQTPWWKKALIGAGMVSGVAATGAGFALGNPLLALTGIALGVSSRYAAYRQQQKPKYKFGDSVGSHYSNWTEDQKTNMSVTSRGDHLLNVRHNRGAPYLTMPGVRANYTGFISDTVGSENQNEIASDLLGNTNLAIRTEHQQRSAALMEGVVGLAEEWRKRGASWVFRAILRGVKAGRWTMDEVPKLFAFVESADSGRRQVARIQDVKAGRLDPSALVGEEQHIMGYGSDIDDSGYESDPSVRSRHKMKGKRLYSKMHD